MRALEVLLLSISAQIEGRCGALSARALFDKESLLRLALTLFLVFLFLFFLAIALMLFDH
jgi:hypothetical protein